MRHVCLHLIALLLAVLPGCAIHLASPQAPTDAHRRASFQPYQHLQVDGSPLGQVVARRTALLFGDSDLAIEHLDEGLNLTAAPLDEQRPPYRGLAVPLTRDGYFLTAAHVLLSDQITLVLPMLDEPAVRARVVWRSQSWRPDQKLLDSSRETDIAILHAPVEIDADLQWADLDALPPDTPLVGGTLKWTHPVSGRLIGITDTQPADPPLPVRYFAYEAPTKRGDSGGPILLTDGRLLGVHVGHEDPQLNLGIVTIHSRRVAIGIAPDPEAIMAIIENDRAAAKAE